MRRSILMVMLALGAAACAPGNVRLTHQDLNSAYRQSEFGYAGAGRDFRVAILGNPFGGDRATFEQAVTAAMQGRNWGPATNFTTAPGSSARDGYRVVMVFDPAPTLNPQTLCGEPPSAPLPHAAGSASVSVFAAWCRFGTALSSVRGEVGGVTGPGDAGFRAMIGRVTETLFPPELATPICAPPNCD